MKVFHLPVFNSEGRKFADLQIGGVFRDFNNERLILEFFHLIISYPKISRENQFWHYRALKNNRKVLMSRFDEGPSFEDTQYFLDWPITVEKIRDEITFLVFFLFLIIQVYSLFLIDDAELKKNDTLGR